MGVDPWQPLTRVLVLIVLSQQDSRRSYMKHDRLAKILVQAAGMSLKSQAAKRLVGWKREGNRHAGNFTEVADEVC